MDLFTISFFSLIYSLRCYQDDLLPDFGNFHWHLATFRQISRFFNIQSESLHNLSSQPITPMLHTHQTSHYSLKMSYSLIPCRFHINIWNTDLTSSAQENIWLWVHYYLMSCPLYKNCQISHNMLPSNLWKPLFRVLNFIIKSLWVHDHFLKKRLFFGHSFNKHLRNYDW